MLLCGARVLFSSDAHCCALAFVAVVVILCPCCHGVVGCVILFDLVGVCVFWFALVVCGMFWFALGGGGVGGFALVGVGLAWVVLVELLVVLVALCLVGAVVALVWCRCCVGIVMLGVVMAGWLFRGIAFSLVVALLWFLMMLLANWLAVP